MQSTQSQPEHASPAQKPEPEKELYQWKAPARLFKKRNREFFSTIAALVILLSVILVFAKEFLLIGVILALGFVAYVLASVPPETVKHELTNRGIRTAERLYMWQDLGNYWWEEKWNQKVLKIGLPMQFPGELQLLLGEGSFEEIEKVVGVYLVKEKPLPTWADKASNWLSEKVPLESEDEKQG